VNEGHWLLHVKTSWQEKQCGRWPWKHMHLWKVALTVDSWINVVYVTFPRKGSPFVLSESARWASVASSLFALSVKGLELCCFPNRAYRASGFLGQDSGVSKLDALIQVYAVLSQYNSSTW